MADLDKPRWTDRAIVFLTIAIVILAGLQWREMVGSGEQTDRIIKADERLAKAMENSVANSQEALEKTLAQNRTAMQNSSGQSGRSLDVTIKASRLDQRAWVGVGMARMDNVEVGKRIQVTVNAQNTGRTFALKATNTTFLGLFPSKLSKLPPGPTLESFDRSIGLLSPNGSYGIVLTSGVPLKETDKQDVTENWYTYTWGDINYYDIFRRKHLTQFCFYRKGTTGEFLQCPMHNYAD